MCSFPGCFCTLQSVICEGSAWILVSSCLSSCMFHMVTLWWWWRFISPISHIIALAVAGHAKSHSSGCLKLISVLSCRGLRGETAWVGFLADIWLLLMRHDPVFYDASISFDDDDYVLIISWWCIYNFQSTSVSISGHGKFKFWCSCVKPEGLELNHQDLPWWI